MKEEFKKDLTKAIIVSLIAIIILFLFGSVLFLAWLSVKIDCFTNMTMEEKNEIRVGYFYVNESNPDSCYIEILVEENTTAFRKTLAHERTHLKQLKAGILADCSHPIRRYINEMEANFVELFVW